MGTPWKSTRIKRARDYLGQCMPWAEPKVLDGLIENLAQIFFPETNLTDVQAMVGALGRAMGLEPGLNSGRMAEFAEKVLEAGYNKEQLEKMYDSENPDSPWCRDWVFKKGYRRHPTEKDIRLTARRYREEISKFSGPVRLEDL